MRPKCSAIWTYFNEVDDQTVRCNLCNQTYSRKGRGTSGLRSHLQSRHKTEYTKYKKCDAALKKAEVEKKQTAAGVSLLSFTVHGINDNFKRVSLVLKCVTHEERHTGDLVAQKLDEIREEWDIPRQKLHAMVRDGGSNMRRAARISQIDEYRLHLTSITVVYTFSFGG
ncbi:unnamed protein product [Euphydryas editha]|uniref:BED-type domain-containing protein n=1 Tax=Euphydryas editha TaxID=104508 RepID=A0AAU9TPC9_EUPED|nr:unnamed protein product [Euphydryas editha]